MLIQSAFIFKTKMNEQGVKHYWIFVEFDWETYSINVFANLETSQDWILCPT